jgi:hypothetical protein
MCVHVKKKQVEGVVVLGMEPGDGYGSGGRKTCHRRSSL